MSDLMLSYYGDDFTGSTDVMESLSFSGLKTVLFLGPPTSEQMAHFTDLRAVGVAGRTRSMAPGDMDRELVPVYEAFKALNTPIVHYKTCSTFDSSPDIGSIGHAIDLGRDVFGSEFVPLVVGAPALNRYCVFGNLFARSGLDSELFRLDRHPTMKRHPITPMDEADIRVHLSRQTRRSIGLVDVLDLALAGRALDAAFDRVMSAKPEVVLFDTLNEAHLPSIGRLICERAPIQPQFVAGSSGVEYALVAYWKEAGLLPEAVIPPALEAAGPIVVVSGSCSPVTAGQIDFAVQNGFGEVALDPVALVNSATADQAVETGIADGLRVLQQGRSVILHTGRGPDDPRIGKTMTYFQATGYIDLEIRLRSGAILGRALGRILKGILAGSDVRRAATAGGVTSFYIARALGVWALEAVAPAAPGSPMCRVYGQGLEDVQMTFKGGQVGKVDFFVNVRTGRF